MLIVIAGLGVLMCLVALVMAIVPGKIQQLIPAFEITTLLRIAAGTTRIFIGACFFLIAPQTAHPNAAIAVGTLIIVMGIGIIFMSNAAGQKLLSRVANVRTATMRQIAVGVAGFGWLLVYISGIANT